MDEGGKGPGEWVSRHNRTEAHRSPRDCNRMHRVSTGLGQMWSCTGSGKQTWTLTPKQQAISNWHPPAKEKLIFFNRVSLSILITLTGRSHAQQYMAVSKQTQWYFYRLFVSYDFVWACFLLYWTFLAYYGFQFYVFMPCMYAFLVFFSFLKIFCMLAFFFLKREKERAWSWVGREVGRIWAELGRGNQDQNTLYGKIIFNNM